MISSVRLDGTSACLTIEEATDTEVFQGAHPLHRAQEALSPRPTRLVSRFNPNVGDEGSKKSFTLREAGGVPDADLRGLPLADGQVDSEEVVTTHTDFMGGEDDHAVGLVGGQLGAQQECIG